MKRFSILSSRTVTTAGVAVVCLAIGFGIATAAQPHMRNALNALNTAKSQLNQAAHNKGGHRVNAINLINQAITEVNLGIQYANTH